MSAGIIEPKPGVDIGRVVVDVRIENAEDRDRLERREIAPDQVRSVTVRALVDTMDWRVDTTARRLVGNPEHGGAWMAEVF